MKQFSVTALAARHRAALADNDYGTAPPPAGLQWHHEERALTGRWRMAGGVQMAETLSPDCETHPSDIEWVGAGDAGLYRIRVMPSSTFDFDIVAETTDQAWPDWDQALKLMVFHMSDSTVAAPLFEAAADAADPACGGVCNADAAIRAAADEVRDAQLELAMQSIAACEVAPAYFKVRDDNPWKAAAARAEVTRERLVGRGRPAPEPWVLGRHFGIVAAWTAMRRARPVPRLPTELEMAASSLFFLDDLPTGRICRAGGVTMFEADMVPFSRAVARTIWRGRGQHGRTYCVTTRVDGCGDLRIQAFPGEPGPRFPDDSLHRFVLSESGDRPQLLAPGRVDPASLRPTEELFDRQLTAAFEAIAVFGAPRRGRSGDDSPAVSLLS